MMFRIRTETRKVDREHPSKACEAQVELRSPGAPSDGDLAAVFHAIVENLGEPVFAYGLDRTFVYVSPSLAHSLGYEPEDLLNRSISGIVHPEDVRELGRLTVGLLESINPSVQIEARLLMRNGNWRFHAVRICHVQNWHGTTACFIGTARDVSERRDALQRLARSESLLRGVAIASGTLLESDSLEGGLADCLGTFCQHAPIESVCIFRDHAGPGSTGNAFSLVASASDDRSDFPPHDFDLQNVQWDPKLSRWREVLSVGGLISSRVDELPAREQGSFSAFGIKGVMVVPIFVSHRFWGCVSFHSFRESWTWGDGDRQSLRSLANHVGSFVDRIQARRTELDASRTLQSLVNASPVGLLIADESLRIHSINPAYCALVGASKEEILSGAWHLSTGSTPEGFDATLLAVDTLAKEGRCAPYEKEYLHSSGERVPVLIYLAKLPRPGWMAAYVIDLRPQRRAEAALRESEASFRSIVTNCRDLISTVTLDGRITYMSPSCEAVLGVTADAVTGHAVAEYLHEEDRAYFFANVLRLKFGEVASETIEVRMRHVNGTWRRIAWHGALVCDANDRPHHIVGVGSDVTERAENEDRLRRLTQELREVSETANAARDAALAAARAKSQFLANMSHEIRTPLNGVLGMTSLLLERVLDEEARDYVATIQSSGHTLLHVIDDVLDFSKIESGGVVLEKVPIQIDELCKEVAAGHLSEAADRRLMLGCHGRTDLPAILVDSVRVRQVLSNLVANAVKFTHFGEVTIEWKLISADTHWTVRIEVSDTGIGVPEDRLHDLFDSFTQADATMNRRYGGTGLGLAISRRLVEMMGGRIGVETAIDEGSTFWFELPVQICQSTATLPVPSIESRPDQFSGMRVLLAEDNPVNVKVASRLLDRLGCFVEVAENGMAAISMAFAQAYDVILMDVQMPVCDGLEATCAIRAQESREVGAHLPIVALTANALPEDRAACARAGMDGFLAKPLTLGALAQGLAPFSHRDATFAYEQRIA